MAVILDTQESCNRLEEYIKNAIATFFPKQKLCLASVAVGEDYSAKIYRSSQQRVAEELGVEYRPIDLSSDISFEDFKTEIKKLNNDPSVTGIILNKPFPSEWPDVEVFSQLDVKKDVEGMHPLNLGKFLIGGAPMVSPLFSPQGPRKLCISPTVWSIVTLLDRSEIAYRGKKATIVGFSPLIGKPLAFFLANEFATVSITHIVTFEKGDLPEYIKNADIVISAAGVPHLIKGDWIKKGAVVIDVGTGKKDGKLTGDVEFDVARMKAAFITPVPGGVGKLTTMFLYCNLIIAAKSET